MNTIVNERKIIIACIFGERILGNEELARKYEKMLADYPVN